MNEHTTTKLLNYPRYFYWIVILATCFILYGNTLTHDYALDDAIVITKNEFTKQGVKGIPDILQNDSFTGFFGEEKNLVTGGRYRPLSVITFSLEYELFGLNPFVGHLVNVLLYSVLGILLFGFMLKIGTARFGKKETAVLLALLSSLFFIAHPLHTEVVANLKGRDEILALTFGLGSMLLCMNAIRKQRYANIIGAAILFFFALLSKENAAVFIIIIPLSIYLFTGTGKRQIGAQIVPLAVVLALYVFIRSNILDQPIVSSGELMNNPFIEAQPGEKAGTILLTLGFYIRLLIFPHPLTYDYYPYHITLTSWKSIIPLISFVVYLALIIIVVVRFRKKNIISYSILWYLIPLIPVSNIFFPVGVFMSERFLFFSSVGFCLFLAFMMTKYLFQKWKMHLFTILLALGIMTMYGLKTIDRNKAWKDDYTLFTTDVLTSSNSAKANTTAGGSIYERAMKTENKELRNELLLNSKTYLQKAIRIYPSFTDARLLLGNVNWELHHNFDSVWPQYAAILKKSPQHNEVLSNMKAMVSQMEQPQKKVDLLRLLHRYMASDYEVNYLLGSNYGKGLQMLDSARYYLKKAVEIKPTSEALKDLGVTYGINGEPEKAIVWFEKALARDSMDRQIYINLGVSHQHIGNLKQARDYFSKAQQMEP